MFKHVVYCLKHAALVDESRCMFAVTPWLHSYNSQDAELLTLPVCWSLIVGNNLRDQDAVYLAAGIMVRARQFYLLPQ